MQRPRKHRAPRAAEVDPLADLAAAQAAAELQARAPGWLVMWRRWGRVYSAWECRDPREVRIIERPDLAALHQEMRLVDIELRQIPRPSTQAPAAQPTPVDVAALWRDLPA
ncbi:hypothetical protein [Planomonospora sp. ID82291]|uniref:hypothetical protein n=1 Tax=Planomonospora sp. ID82291 TaxID=2738136 RepID=UPI0018C3DD14|nr:hypothetical protein [Planomonospora sp. ID82291]MBG0819062.1 hypothetical protein [Planomonospora sp. ID82291]